MSREVPFAEREARRYLLEESIRLLLERDGEENALALEAMRALLRTETEAAALNLPEDEPPAWLVTAARRIPVRWAEGVTQAAAERDGP